MEFKIYTYDLIADMTDDVGTVISYSVNDVFYQGTEDFPITDESSDSDIMACLIENGYANEDIDLTEIFIDGDCETTLYILYKGNPALELRNSEI